MISIQAWRKVKHCFLQTTHSITPEINHPWYQLVVNRIPIHQWVGIKSIQIAFRLVGVHTGGSNTD